MNVASIQILKLLLKTDARRRDLCAVGVGSRQVSNLLADLQKRGYVACRGRLFGLPDTPKAALLREAAAVADIAVLLRGSNEDVFAVAASGADADRISQETGRSRSTVQRSISDLRSVGALRKHDGAFTAEGTRRPFPDLARLLQLERSARRSGSAQILYSGSSAVIRKVGAGARSPGHPTGFSAFAAHGIEYRTVHDYYCDRRDPPDTLDILLHAILAAKASGSRSAMAMCVIFYTKFRDRVDPADARRRARSLGVGGAWLDVESYVRGAAPHDAGLFLPRGEFLQKARLYGIRDDEYDLPRPDEALFGALGSEIESPVDAYLIGGENMRIKGLKDSTRDCDIVVGTGREAGAVAGALRRLGYSESTLVGSDARIRPMRVFEHPSKSRIDLFCRTVAGKMDLSGAMKKAAAASAFGRLRLCLIADEHVFLLKAVTGREGDIDDMASLASGSSEHGRKRFDWNAVFDGIAEQIRADSTKDALASAVLHSVADMGDRLGSRAPVLGRLQRLAADAEIARLLRGGSLPVGQVVSMIRQERMGEALIRNRINALARDGRVSKRRDGRTVLVAAADEGYPHGGRRVSARSLEEYLRWRFCALPVPGGAVLDGAAREMDRLGLSTIGALDGRIRRAAREAPRSRPGAADALGAARACMGAA